MKILVFGAGSIGVYLGTLLESAGNDVTLLGGRKLKQLNDTILISDKPYQLPNRVYSLKKNLVFDIIFITSKLYDLENNLRILLKNKIKSTYLVIIQNGIVDESLYRPYVNNYKFVAMSVFEGYRLIENQLTIAQSESGWKTDNSETGKMISSLLVNAGIKCKAEVEFEQIRAEKTIMNCSVNLLSAIKKKTCFELLNNENTKIIVDKLFDESYNVLKNYISLMPKEKLKELFYNVIGSMRHYSSTYQDLVSGRKTEVDFLNGFIVRLGKKYDVKTPENEKVLNEFYKMYKK